MSDLESDATSEWRGRREVLRGMGACLAGAGIALVSGGAARAAVSAPGEGRVRSGGTSTNLTPDQALTKLKEGNANWVTGKLLHPDDTITRRQEVASGQNPFAVVFSCIDSRVPPEIVFDQGVGDLFVLRTAAQTLDDLVEASVEYGPVELGTPLVVVMGHQKCGAVTAAVDAIENGTKVPAHLPNIVEAVKPAYTKGGDTAATIDATIRAFTKSIVRMLRGDEPLAANISGGKLDIVGAYYSLDDGTVDWF